MTHNNKRKIKKTNKTSDVTGANHPISGTNEDIDVTCPDFIASLQANGAAESAAEHTNS